MVAEVPELPQPIRKSAQRMRWFLTVFEEQVARIASETGNQFEIDRDLLAEVFAEWLKAFDAQKPSRIEDKEAYVGFAAGLMLRTLIRKGPVRTAAKPEEADETNPAYFWPEGYLYVAFCLNVRGLVIEQDFHGEQHVSAALQDLGTWWSFRENVEQDAGLAIAFLDLFAGEKPDWTMPELFQSGRAKALAARFYAPQLEE